jgi:hypothetical protein
MSMWDAKPIDTGHGSSRPVCIRLDEEPPHFEARKQPTSGVGDESYT